MTIETQDTNKAHKYLSIAEHLRRQINEGDLKTGDRLPKFSELRALFGATPTTVERVYSLLESENLVVREQGRGIFVAGPQTPVLKSTVTLCVRVPLLDHSGAAYWSQLTEGIRETLKTESQSLTLRDDVEPGLAEQNDGLLLMTYATNEQILDCVPRDFPMVSVFIPREGVVSVVADEEGGSRQAVQHLLQLRHRRIAHMTDGSDGSQMVQRLSGYQAALQGAGIEPQENWVLRGDPRASIQNYLEWGRDKMRQWLKEGWSELGCTALTTQNDEMAVGALQVLQDAGIKIPEEVSVIGFDSTIWCDFVSPTLTSVEMPLRKVGVLAAEILQQQIRGERPGGINAENDAASLCLPTRLVVRRSTGPAPA